MRIDFVRHPNTRLSFEIPKHAYVDAPDIEMDEYGKPIILLSKVLPLAAPMNSPLKRNVISLRLAHQVRTDRQIVRS